MQMGLIQAYEYVNPARAGMIPDVSFTLIQPSSKPRASGDDPLPGGLLRPGNL